jgi:hypothetical protein
MGHGWEALMGKIFTHMTMSLDGFIADPDDGVGELFGWYEAGPVTVPSADERWSFQVDEDDGVKQGLDAAGQLAGDKDVCTASASIAARALDLNLVDEVIISLAPVMLGKGIAYFGDLANGPHRFGDPVIIAGQRVTHLRYPVLRAGR